MNGSMLPPKIEAHLKQVGDDCRRAFGDDLVCLVLYGSAAAGDFVAGKSDLNFAIVLKRIEVAQLRALGELLPAWHRLDVATPLFVDQTFVARARDVFPMEMLDIQAEHRLLAGVDVFADLVIDFDHLRFQLEQEARGKLLRLRVQFAEAGGKRGQVEQLMLASVRTFVALMRAVLRMRREPTPSVAAELLQRFERDLGVPLPALAEVLAVQQGERRWSGSADATFAAYLADIERLVDFIDRATGFAPPEEH